MKPQQPSLVDLIFFTADTVQDGRKIDKVLRHAQSEMGELTDEVIIEMGESYKKPGPDGVIGESIDAIICLVDLIRVHQPDITEKQLVAIAMPKLKKWIAKIAEINAKKYPE